MTYADWDVNIGGQPGQPGGPTGPTGPAGPGYAATSLTSNTIGVGSKTFTTQAGLAYTIGARVRAHSRGSNVWMEGICTAYDPGTGIITLNVDLTSAMVFTGQIAGIPQCGRLTISGTPSSSGNSSLAYLPYNGDLIKINGVIYTIPPSGIVGLGSTNVYVNGVAGQNILGTNVLYYVYVFNNGGVLTADFCGGSFPYVSSTTPGNVGVMIKGGATPDDTRSLIGMVLGSGTSPNVFYDTPTWRLMRSWFNRPRVNLNGTGVNAFGITTVSTWINMGGGGGFINFAGEPLLMTMNSFMSTSVQVSGYHGYMIDATVQFSTQVTSSVVNYYYNMSGSWQSSSYTEGFHNFSLAGQIAGAATMTCWGNTGGILG